MTVITLDDALKMYKAQQDGAMKLPPPEYRTEGAPKQAPALTAEQVTIEHLEAACQAIAEQRGVCDQVAAVKKEQDKELESRENKLLDLFKLLEKTNYQSKVGTFSVSHRLSVRVPSNADDRQAFFEHLRKNGLFEQMITVNSATLNSWYKAEFEAAKDAGNGMDFTVPGIGEPSIQENLSFRRAMKSST